MTRHQSPLLGLVVAVAAAAAVVVAPGRARAQDTPDVPHDEGSVAPVLRTLLLAVHEAPSLAAVERASEDPVRDLAAIASDQGEVRLVRRRAVLLLGTVADPRARTILTGLLETSTAPDLRRAAAFALARRLGERDPAALVDLLAPLLASRDADDREVAVVLLGRTAHPDARTLLERLRHVERHRAVVDALRNALRAL